jgi:hypothetical protein
MKRLLPYVCSLAAALGLCAAGRADMVPWTYSVSANTPNPVMANSSMPMSSITLGGESMVNAVGSTGVVLSGLTANSTQSPSTPDTFTSTPWGVNLTITDTPSGQSKTLTIAGAFSGTMSSGSSIITSSFTSGPMTFTLGSDTYTVTPDSFTSPSAPGASNSGGIGATVSVNTPEPSSLLLCGLGAAGCVLARRKRRAVVA